MLDSLDTDQPLSALISQLQKKYKEEDDESELLKRMYNGLADSSTSSKEDDTNLASKRYAKKSKIDDQTSSSQDKNLDSSITDKKQIQMIRNRISAQNSRDRRKAYLQELESENQHNKLRIQQFEEQVHELKKSLFDAQRNAEYYQQQLQSIACLQCGSTNIGFREEVPKMKKRNLGSMSYALLALLSIIAIFGIMTTQNQEHSVMHAIKVNQTQEFSERQINSTDSEYHILKAIENNRLRQTGLVQYKAQEENKFLAKETPLAQISYESSKVESVYCPAAIKNKETQNGIQVSFEDGQWIHLVVPKSQMNTFFRTSETSITIREYEQSDSRMSEVWCKVKSVTDLYI